MSQTDSKTKPLQIRLSDKSEQDLEKIMQKTKIDNKTRIVNISLSLMENVIETIEGNGNVIFEHPNGEREKLKIIVG